MIYVSTYESRRVCELLQERTGFIISEERVEQLRLILEELLTSSGEKDFESYFQSISHLNPINNLFQNLLQRVTIGETHFFRDSKLFELLRSTLIPEMLEKAHYDSRSITVLSAACSTGEEIYSLAMLFNEIVDGNSRTPINLIGGDINLDSLKKGMQGFYRRWSFREVTPSLLSRYFTAENDGFQIKDEIKRWVKFQYLNLAEDLPFFDLDLILLRNVLIYFRPEFIKQLIDQCYQVLRDDGWLIVGASELNSRYFEKFEEIDMAGVTLYRKSAKKVTPPPVYYDFNNKYDITFKSDFVPTVKRDEPTISIDKLYKKAESYFDNNRLTDAEELLKQILSRESQNQQAMLLLAKIEANKGNYFKGEDYCKKVLVKYPANLEAYYLLGLIYQASNNLKASVEAFRSAININRKSIMSHLNLSIVYQKLNDKELAKRHLIQAKSLLNESISSAIVKGSDGQTAGQLLQVVETLLQAKH